MTDQPVLETLLLFEPFNVPRLSMTEVQALNLIAQHGSNISIVFPFFDEDDSEALNSCEKASEWSVNFSPLVSDVLRSTCRLSRELEWSGGRMRLQVSSDAPIAWLNANMSFPAIDQLDDAIVTIAFETIITRIFSVLHAETSCGLPLVSTRSIDDVEYEHSWTLTARNNRTGSLSFAILDADTLALMLLANLIKRAPKVDNGIDDSGLPVTVHAQLGSMECRASELTNLAVQDTLFIDHYSVAHDGEMWLVTQGYGLRVRPQESSYCVTQGWTSLMNSISELSTDSLDEQDPLGEEEFESSPSPSVFHVDDLPVRLTFSLGEKRLTLGELRSLHPGAVFDLERPLAAGPVIIRANGRLIGTGDLVNIDGRIGVTLRALGES